MCAWGGRESVPLRVEDEEEELPLCEEYITRSEQKKRDEMPSSCINVDDARSAARQCHSAQQ